MIIRQCEQGSEEWLRARMGIPTASCFEKIITTTGKPSTQKIKYMNMLLGEWMADEPAENKQYAFMEQGTEREDESRAYYEFSRLGKGRELHASPDVGICFLDERKLIGASPDGLIMSDGNWVGGLELKNTIKSTQIEYLRGAQKVPTGYLLQVQGNMMVTGVQWWDFLAYCPGLPPFNVRVDRDEAIITRTRAAVEVFIEDMLKARAELEVLRSEIYAA